MKKQTKRILSMALASCMALGIVAAGGCGGGSDVGNGDFTKGETTKLTVWITGTNQPQYFMGYFEKAFEKANPKIDVTFVPQTNDKLSSGLDAAFSGRNAPDMASTWAGAAMMPMVDGQTIVQIDDVMNGYEENMIDAALLNKVNGHHYSAPIFGFTSPTVYYNKSVFDEHNLTEPTTYEEFVSLCNSIKEIKTSANKQKYTTMVTGYSYHLMMGVHARTCTREDLVKIAQGKSGDKGLYDAPGFYNGYKWVEDMVKDGLFAPNSSGYNETTASNAFTLQKSLMIATTSLDLLELSNNAQFEIGSFLFPDAPAKYKPTYGEGATENSMVSGVYTDSFVINAKTSSVKQMACKKLLEFMYSEEAQSQLFNYYLYPVMKNVSYDSISTAVKPVFEANMKDIYETSKTDGMGIFYMSYCAKGGVMGNLEGGVKTIMNGGSADLAYGSVKAFMDA